MQNLTITAYLKNGFISSDKWSPSLDNILAYCHLKNKLSDSEFAAGCAGIGNDIVIDELPLGIERFNDDWWYQVSSPIVDVNAKNQIHIHRRFDSLHAEKYMLPKKGRIQVQAGQHKNTRIKGYVSITNKVIWHVVGEKIKIAELLENCSHIGSKISAGFGKVEKWELDNGDEQKARFYRPLPVDFAESHNIDGMRMQWGYRPNVRRKENQTLCVMP